jgi:hypothetical protein
LDHTPIAFRFLVDDHGFAMHRYWEDPLVAGTLFTKGDVGLSPQFEVRDNCVLFWVSELFDGRPDEAASRRGYHMAYNVQGIGPRLRTRDGKPIRYGKSLDDTLTADDLRQFLDEYAVIFRAYGGLLLEGQFTGLLPEDPPPPLLVVRLP